MSTFPPLPPKSTVTRFPKDLSTVLADGTRGWNSSEHSALQQQVPSPVGNKFLRNIWMPGPGIFGLGCLRCQQDPQDRKRGSVTTLRAWPGKEGTFKQTSGKKDASKSQNPPRKCPETPKPARSEGCPSWRTPPTKPHLKTFSLSPPGPGAAASHFWEDAGKISVA